MRKLMGFVVVAALSSAVLGTVACDALHSPAGRAGTAAVVADGGSGPTQPAPTPTPSPSAPGSTGQTWGWG